MTAVSQPTEVKLPVLPGWTWGIQNAGAGVNTVGQFASRRPDPSAWVGAELTHDDPDGIGTARPHLLPVPNEEWVETSRRSISVCGLDGVEVAYRASGARRIEIPTTVTPRTTVYRWLRCRCAGKNQVIRMIAEVKGNTTRFDADIATILSNVEITLS